MMASNRHRLWRIALLSCLAALVVAPGALAAEKVAWEQPEQLGAELPSSWFPEIVADQSGTVWAVWETTRDPGEPNVTDANGGAIMLARRDAQGWSAPSNIYVKDIYNAGRPLLMSDGMYLHLLIRTVPEGGPIQRQARMFHMRAPLDANPLDARSWSKPQSLSDTAAYWGQLVMAPDGALIATFNQMTDMLVDNAPDTRMALYSRRSTDHGQSWSAPVRISQSELRAGRNSLVALPDGTLLAAWDEGYDNLTGLGEPLGSATAFSTDGGLTWQGHTTFRRHTEQATLASNGTQALLLYRSTVDDGLYYRESLDQGRSWSDEHTVPDVVMEPYPGQHNFNRLGVATDSAGTITVGYVGVWDSAETGLAVFTTSFAAGEWGPPTLAAEVEGYPEYPRLAVALGNQLELVFFVRAERFVESGHNTIWTAGGSNSAPALAPQPLLTAPSPAPVADRPAADPIQPAVWPSTIPAPEPLPSSLDTSSGPQAALDRPVLWIIAATAGVLLTILAMHTVWRSLQSTRI